MNRSKNRSQTYLLKLSILLNKSKFILILLVIVFFLRLPFLFEPLTNTKEAVIFASSKGLLRNGTDLNFIDLFSIIFTKISFFLFGNSLWSIKFSLTIWILINLLILYFLCQKYLDKSLSVKLVVFLGFLFSIPFLNFWPFSFESLFLLPTLSGLIWINKKYISLSAKAFFIVFILLITSFYIFSPQTYAKSNYYSNFLSYAQRKISTQTNPEEVYYKSFGSDVLTSYNLANYIKERTKSTDKIYLLGNLLALYPLSDRTAASKYIELKDALNHTDGLIEDLTDTEPKFLLLAPKSSKLEQLDRLVKESYNLTAQTENVIIYKFKDNKTR